MAADARGGERRARPRVQRGSRLLFLLGLFDFLLRASVLGHVILPYKWIITALGGIRRTWLGMVGRIVRAALGCTRGGLMPLLRVHRPVAGAGAHVEKGGGDQAPAGTKLSTYCEWSSAPNLAIAVSSPC